MAKAKVKKIKKRVQKSISSRVSFTNGGKKKKGKAKGKKHGKVMMKAAGQAHFNARESGKTMRNKRKKRTASSAITKNIKRLT